MLSAEDLVAAIDAMMAQPKRLVGATSPLVWVDGRRAGEKKIKLPLEIEGEQRGQSLVVLAYPRERPLKFRILLVFPPAVFRLCYETGAVHGNNHAIESENLPAIIQGPHVHPWNLNRRFVKNPYQVLKLRNAEPFDRIRTFDAALRWFCADTRIALPPNHAIELPARDVLI